MPNYKEATVTGGSFSRCRLIEIRNPYLSTPGITFTEERITSLSDRTVRDQPDAPMEVIYDPMTQIDIYDPTTLQPTGQKATMQDIYGLMFSAYFYFAKLRDIEAGKLSATATAAATASATI